MLINTINMSSGGGTINKSGAGEVALTNLSPPTMTGSTLNLNINEGSIKLGNDGTFSSFRSNTKIAQDARLIVNFSGTFNANTSISGAGALEIAENNTLILSGNNSAVYTGDITIAQNAGLTVNVSSTNTFNKALGTGTAITNNGTFNINLTTNSMLNKVIEGSGTINKSGTLLTLTGNSENATGMLNITSGDIYISSGGNYGGEIAFNNNDVSFVRTDDWTFAGTLSGDGNLFVNSGTVTLNRASTDFTGEVEINGSTNVVVENVDALGSSNVENNGILQFSIVNGGDFDNQISGTGRVEVLKDITLSAFNHYSGGTDIAENTALTVQHDYALGNASGIVNNAGTLKLDNADGGIFHTITGNGAVEVMQNVTLYGTNNSYTGETTVYNGVTLTGALPTGGDLVLTENAKYKLGGENRTIGMLTDTATSSIELGYNTLTISEVSTLLGNIIGTPNANLSNVSLTADFTIAPDAKIKTSGTTTVADGATLNVTAVKEADDAPFQGGELVVEGTLKTTFTEYDIEVGQPTKVYLGKDITGFDAENGIIEENNVLYTIIETDGKKLNFDEENELLFYTLQKGDPSDLFPNLPPGIGNIIDDFDGNDFLENVLETGGKQAEIALQSAFDIVNQTAAMSALYHTKQNIGNAIYTRTQIVPGYFGTHYRGQSSSNKRESWAAPIYGNSKGFRLTSGNFRYGHVNDQYAMAFGMDTVQKGTRLGIMGLGGWGKARSSGELLTTYNETNFGGMYVYANKRSGNTDYLFTAGYLGMDNDFEQVNLGGNLSGKMSSGLATVSATLTKTFCLGEMHMVPMLGIEYDYYHQGDADIHWNNTTALHNDKSHANIVTLPIGVNFTAENRLANGAILTPEFRGRYIANVGDVVSSYAVSLPGSSSTALMATRMSDRHAGDIGVGLGLSRGGTTLRLDYGYMFSQHYREHYGSAMARWAF